MTRLIAIAAAAGFVIGLLLGWHFGRQGLEVKEQRQEIAQERAQDTKRTTDQGTIAREGTAYENAALDPLPAPDVRVCHYTATSVPSAAAARPAPDAQPPSRGPDPVPSEPGPNIGPALLRTGHLIDTQVIQLQDYITHVCQGKP